MAIVSLIAEHMIDRLRTIVSYDRICVMDNGNIVEFDAPGVLYEQNGIFRAMCDRSNIMLDDIRRSRVVSSFRDSLTSFRYSNTTFRDSVTSFKYSNTTLRDSVTSFSYSNTTFRDSVTSFGYSNTTLRDSVSSFRDSLTFS